MDYKEKEKKAKAHAAKVLERNKLREIKHANDKDN